MRVADRQLPASTSVPEMSTRHVPAWPLSDRERLVLVCRGPALPAA
ncbi:hypothetical protein [Fodinicola feengrottensis]|nr:hypothetical protein [Fodinicola feengrottensis]